MGSMVVTSEILAAKFETIFPHLDERQRRLLMGAGPRAAGPGTAARRGAQAGGRRGSGAAPGAAGPGGAAGAGRSDVAAAVDDEVDPRAGGRVDPPGPQSGCRHRGGP